MEYYYRIPLTTVNGNRNNCVVIRNDAILTFNRTFSAKNEADHEHSMPAYVFNITHKRRRA